MRRMVLTAALLASVLVGTTQAQVCDLVEVGNVVGSGHLYQPGLLGNTAYVAAGTAGILRFDVSDPSAISLLGITPTTTEALDLVLDYFSTNLVVARGSGGVGLYLLDAQGVPAHASTLDLSATMISVIGGGSQYLAGSEEGTLYTVSTGGGQATLEGSIALGGPVLDIVQENRRVYCALGASGLAVVDLSSRATPQLLDVVDLGGAVLSVTHEGTMLYAGVEGVGLVSLDIEADTVAPASSLTLPDAPTHLISWGGRLFMSGPDAGLMVADASLGTDVLVLSHLELQGASGIEMVGSDLYVARGDDGFSAVDGHDCSTSGVHPTTSFVPAAARAVGAADTYWVTDLAIANLTTDVAIFNLAYLVKNQENSSPLNLGRVLQPGEQLLVNDVFDTLFELEAGNGALRITVSNPDVKITSRTYNAAGAAGTYGQFIPAQVAISALQEGLVGVLMQLQENAGFRTNIGLLNPTPDTVVAEVRLYYGNGSLAGVHTETLEPYEMVQRDRLFATVGAGTVDSGYALVRSDGQVMAYASVVDNGSGDPVFIPLQQLTTPTPWMP